MPDAMAWNWECIFTSKSARVRLGLRELSPRRVLVDCKNFLGVLNMMMECIRSLERFSLKLES